MQYAHARDIGLDCLADRVLEIAETPLVAEKRVQKADGSVEITTADAVDNWTGGERLTESVFSLAFAVYATKKTTLPTNTVRSLRRSSIGESQDWLSRATTRSSDGQNQ